MKSRWRHNQAAALLLQIMAASGVPWANLNRLLRGGRWPDEVQLDGTDECSCHDRVHPEEVTVILNRQSVNVSDRPYCILPNLANAIRCARRDPSMVSKGFTAYDRRVLVVTIVKLWSVIKRFDQVVNVVFVCCC